MELSLSDEQREELIEILIEAFPTLGDIKRMVQFELNMNLNEVVISWNLRVVFTALIKWAEDNHRLNELILGAQNDNPDNLRLERFVNTYL